jgi:ketosteroid isomerase-like protein
MPDHDRSTVERALATFIDAFSNLDQQRVEACFTEDVTVFNAYGGKRQIGFWCEEFDAWRATRPGPPYLTIQPKDLILQDFGAVVVVSFHLETEPNVQRRRTIVLTKQPDGWRIAHLHASNVPTNLPANVPGTV